MTRALAGALALVWVLAGAGSAWSACAGRDLFPELERDPAFAAAMAEARRGPFARGRLFRIVPPSGAPSYLYGTIHVSDPAVTAFSPALSHAIDGARVVALELKEASSLSDPAMLNGIGLSLLGAILARTDERPDRLLGAEEFARLEAAIARRGLPGSAARTFKPAVLALALATPACVAEPQDQPFVDALIGRMALERGIPVVGLETVQEQLAVLGALSPEAGRQLLTSSLAVADHAEAIVATTLARYRAGDIGALLAWMQSARPVPGVEAEPPAAFFETLIDQRNRRMRDRARPHLAAGGALIAVGAAHIPGPRGLARLLEEDGYRIEPVDEETAP